VYCLKVLGDISHIHWEALFLGGRGGEVVVTARAREKGSSIVKPQEKGEQES